MEQLLWHIVVLEALFGDKKDTTECLRRRISQILGKTEEEKIEIRKKIGDLYKFRSDLVHGNKFKKQVYRGHLRDIRNIARNSLLEFISFLTTRHSELMQKQIPFKNYPKRKKLLSILDCNKEA